MKFKNFPHSFSDHVVNIALVVIQLILIIAFCLDFLLPVILFSMSLNLWYLLLYLLLPALGWLIIEFNNSCF